MAVRGRWVAMAVVALATILLAVPAALFWKDLVESWYLRKLESPEFSEKVSAIERLGHLRSTRAIPRFQELLRAMQREAAQKAPWKIDVDGDDVGDVLPSGLSAEEDEEYQRRVGIIRAMITAAKAIGPEGAPQVFSFLKDQDLELRQCGRDQEEPGVAPDPAPPRGLRGCLEDR